MLRRGGEVLATALVVAFVSLRCMELIDVYCQSRLHLVLHAGLALLAALRPGLPRVTLLAVLYGVMRHRLDVQVRVRVRITRTRTRTRTPSLSLTLTLTLTLTRCTLRPKPRALPVRSS